MKRKDEEKLKKLEILELSASIIDNLREMGASEEDLADLMCVFNSITSKVSGEMTKSKNLEDDNNKEHV